MLPGASVYDGDLYETPLGDVPVDRDLVEELLDQRRSVRFVAEAEKREHSVEVQVPFLQHALAQFEIVPMLVYDTSFANCESVASDLAAACHRFPRQTLIVASSDLYHGPGSREAREASLRTARALEEESARAFSDGVDQGRYQACGSGPITIAKLIAERHGCGRPEVVQVTTSHEVARGSEDYVVGYLGAVVR
jgi:hypothetical protein